MTPQMNLPAPAPEPPGDPGKTPISQVPTAALIFTLGYTVAKPEVAHRHYGGIAAIGDELTRRGQFDQLRASLPRNVAAVIEVMYRADRGQRMAGSGVHRQKSGN